MNRYDILALLFPNKCLICGVYLPANQFACESCAEKLEKGTERNFNIVVGKNSNFFKVLAPYFYKEQYRTVIDRFKFKGKTSYARKLCGLLLEIYDPTIFQSYTVVTYVPMTKKAKKSRGYNQAELLAKQIAKLLGIECRPLLIKKRDSGIQHQLSAVKRKENIKGVYEVDCDIFGQNIILVDDIITTGATICECAKLLYKAKANRVLGVCAANTPPPSIEEK